MPETLPFDIIMNILRMRPRDSQMKSPTADLIKEEFLNTYTADCEFRYSDDYPTHEHWAPIFSRQYFFWYKTTNLYSERRRKFEQLYCDAISESETESDEDDE